MPASKPPGRRRWQVGLRSLFLLMAAIAVWMAYFVNRRHNAALEARIKTLVPLAHELIIDDPKKIAVVRMEEYWYDENRWDLYLPEGRYRLCIATRGVDDQGFAPVVKTAPIEAGRHQLALEQRQGKDAWRVITLWDGKELMAVEEPKDWDPGLGAMSSADYALSQQLPPDQPVVLFRRRFSRRDGKGVTTSSTGPTEGILLWIERTAALSAKP
jgi:hypothetical protein